MKNKKLQKTAPVQLTSEDTQVLFTTEDLMKLGLSREEANDLMMQLCEAGAVRLVPMVVGTN